MADLTTFANAVGSLPLAQLDSNFANVNSNASFAITAGTVTANTQSNITQLGNLVNLVVDGNAVSNVVVTGLLFSNSATVFGNLSANNLNSNNQLTTVALTVSNTAAVAGNLSANSISTNALTVSGGTNTGNLTTSGLNFVSVNTVTNSSPTANIQLSGSTSYNLIINNINSNILIIPPAGATEGQITAWTIGGNSNTQLGAFSGTWIPSFDGNAAPGSAYRYVSIGNTWYKLG